MQQNAAERTMCVYYRYNKNQFNNDECKLSCATHTVPYIGRHWGAAAIQHEEQVVVMRKKQNAESDVRPLQVMATITA